VTALGVGAVIGTGIFVVIGEGIGIAGPAVILSFVLAGVTCVFSALCYAELASSIPVSGSAYTYAYATLGELIAWIIGWDLVLEYGVSVAAVAVGWGGNLNEFLDNTFGFALPDSIALSRDEGGTVNLPAVAIVVAVTFVLMRGVRETARANLVMVVLKLLVLAFFIVVAFSAASKVATSPRSPPTGRSAWWTPPRSSSSPTSASTPSRPAPRRRRTPSATSRSRSSARS
jgi:basic amino acid/polyamine antiporter, APA family